MGRPKLEIDAREVGNYARLGCNNVEIAAMFSCDEGTIRKRFSETLAKARSERKARLRAMQWEAAKKGNVTMLIWLGKNELKQSDQGSLDDDHTFESGASDTSVDAVAFPSGAIPAVPHDE